MDTALVSLPTPSQYVSRSAEDNPHVAAFLGDELVWGTPPPIRQVRSVLGCPCWASSQLKGVVWCKRPQGE